MFLSLDKEQVQIKKAAADFASGEMADHAQEWDAAGRMSSEIMEEAVELGFVGMTLPERQGGAGLGLLEDCLVAEEFAVVSPGGARAILETGWGCELLSHTGGLPPPLVDKASDRPMLGLAYPADGNPFRAEACAGVSSTFSPVHGDAELFLIPGFLDGEEGLFFLGRDSPGLDILPLEDKVGLRCWPGARLELRGAALSEECFYKRPRVVERSRQAKAIRSSALGVGLSRGAALLALAYARGRQIFERNLSDFEATRAKFFKTWQRLQALRLLVYKAAADWDKGLDVSLASRSAEAMAVELGNETADEALQLHGGYGYFEEMKIAMFYRDAVMLDLLSEPASSSIEAVWASLSKTVCW